MTGATVQLRHNALMLEPSRKSWPREAAAAAGFAALCLAVGATAGAITRRSLAWYAALEKPAFTPPDGLFAPVWTLLYLMMALAAWRVWRRAEAPLARPALGLWALQLALNLCWSFVFFGARLVGAALAEIAVLLVAIAATAVLFWRVDRVAGWLLAPYAAWVAFAALLNAAILALNS